MEIESGVLQLAAKELKLKWDEIKDDLKVVVYTDGGAVKCTKVGGFATGGGVHGYIYVDTPTKTNSNAPDGHSPTVEGYLPKAKVVEPLYKVSVLTYFDVAIPLGKGTNNTAELSAGLVALALILESQEKEDFTITGYRLLSDSEYFVKHYNEFLEGWHERGYTSATGSPLKNVDLWKKVHALKQEIGSLGVVTWVKAHDGEAGNTIADYLATCGVNMTLNGAILPAWVHLYQKEYGDTTHELSPVLTEKRFYIHRDNLKNNIYYQMSMGKRWPSDEEGKRDSVGKRIADTCISVVHLEKAETVLDDLSDFCRDKADLSGLMYGRLDFLNKGGLHNRLNTLGCDILRPTKMQVITPTDTELLTELNPARLSWRLAQQYETLADILYGFVTYYPEERDRLLYEVQEITGQIYLNKEGKTKSYELYDEDEDNAVIPVRALVNDRDTVIDLTMDVDIPSLASLKRLGKLLPEVYLLTWSDHKQDKAVNYACVFKVGGDTGLWTSAYSNMHFLSNP